MTPIYSRFEQTKLILRDELAIDRTLLANERTLLAYLRSGLALLIAGATIIHFSQAGWFRLVGLICLPAGIVAGVAGIWRYRRMNRGIALVRNMGSSATTDQPSDAPRPGKD